MRRGATYGPHYLARGGCCCAARHLVGHRPALRRFLYGDGERCECACVSGLRDCTLRIYVGDSATVCIEHFYDIRGGGGGRRSYARISPTNPHTF